MVAVFFIACASYGICFMILRLQIHLLYSKYYDLIKKEYPIEYVKAFIDNSEEQMFGGRLGKAYPGLITDISEHDKTNIVIKRHNTLVKVYRIINIGVSVIIMVIFSIM